MSSDTVVDLGPLRIRHKRMTDVPDDFAWRRDPELTRYDGAAPLGVTYPEYVAVAEHDIRYGATGRASFSLETDDGRHVGNLMYYNANASRDEAEVGISLALEEVRGRGLGPAVMVAFLRFLWATTSFRVLHLRTLEWNARAITAFARAGFSESGRLSEGDQRFVIMQARREWWLLWDSEGRFEPVLAKALRPPPERTEGA
ncbi:MAG: GNAT family N-acetyltransferase [Dehalococcoidia bacterium]